MEFDFEKMPVIEVDANQTSLDDYMSETFGCDATDESELPDDEPSLTVFFERA